MTKNKNAFMAGFAEVKKNSKKVAQIRSEKKSMKYGLKVCDYSDYEEDYEDDFDLDELLEEDDNEDDQTC